MNLLKQYLKSVSIVKNNERSIQWKFNYEEEEEYLFQKSNNCWIFKKVIDNENEKVRNHCHKAGKFRGSAHWVVT